MTPRAFLEQIVRPNVVEFHEHYADLRRAHNAISTADALAAHMYEWAKEHEPDEVSPYRTDSLYRNALAERDPDFRMVRDIAKAQKHVHLTKHNPQVTKASQVTSRPIGYGQGGYGQGRFGGPKQIVVDTGPNQFCYVEGLLDRALSFLEGEMAALNVD